MRKAIIIILAMVVALSALPVTFACYNGGWGNWYHFWRPNQPVYCCPTDCNLTFTSVSTSDVEDKDVGETTACINPCTKNLVITIDNAYPGYKGIVKFDVTNTGARVATITGITPDYPDPAILQIDLTGEVQVGTVIAVCETKEGTLEIHGLAQEDTQKRTFTFNINIDYDCTYVPPGGGCNDGWGGWGNWGGNWGGYHWGGYNWGFGNWGGYYP